MNFKILTVNGRDLSGASHETASEAFKNASEPITVILRRTNNSHSNNSTSHSITSPKIAKKNTAMLEQTNRGKLTQNRGTHPCFCRFLIEKCKDSSDPLHSFVMRQLIQYKNLNFNEESTARINTESSEDSFPTEDEDDFYDIDYEEVLLKQPSNHEKLGIMLCDRRDPSSGQIKVIVSEVAINSIAARCQKIRQGDHIVKINGSPVASTKEASRVLHKNIPSISFTIGHPRVVTICDNSGATESDESNILAGSENQAEKDSGIDRTIGSTTQSSMDNITHKIAEAKCFSAGYSNTSSVCYDSAKDFTCVQPPNYNCKKRPLQSENKVTSPEDSADSAKGSMDRPKTKEENTVFQQLSEAIQHLELEESKTAVASQLSTIEDTDDESDENVSPWVKIARQDYRDKIRQLETDGDLRNLHPAMISHCGADNLNDVISAMSAPRSPITTDNTSSSAYSTGESLRSSSTESSSPSNNIVPSPSSSPSQKRTTDQFLPDDGHWNALRATMTYYMSSDANSDGEGPACYLTHNEGSDSEGFEDAGLEFSASMFNSTCKEVGESVALPRLLHSLVSESTGFVPNSPTASTKEFYKATVAVGKTRRHSLEPVLSKYHASFSQQDKRNNTKKTCTNDRSRCKTDSAANGKNPYNETAVSRILPYTHYKLEKQPCSERPYGPKVRRKSTGSRNTRPNLAEEYLLSVNQSKKAVEKGETNHICEESSNGEVRMEWKVRVSKDGTRYITKRPVREKVLRNREKRLLAERCGVTTDDDLTELKLGRHWSLEERKRHLRHAREKKRRRDFMQRCRLEVLNENMPADGEIVELSHKKMTRQKHKRMLLDNFVTVQEILAHGDRSSGVTKLNPLLSVTYI